MIHRNLGNSHPLGNCLWRVWIWPSRMVATKGCKGLATTKPGTWLPTQAALCLGMHRRRAVHPKTLVDVPFVHIKWLEHGYNFSVFKQPLDVDTVRYDLNMLGCNETYHSGNMGFWPIFHMYRSRIHLFKNTSTLQPRDPRTKLASFSQGIQKIMVSSSGKWYMQLFIVYRFICYHITGIYASISVWVKTNIDFEWHLPINTNGERHHESS